MRKNQLRKLLKEGKSTIGTRILSAWPGIVEVIGHTGAIDYVEFVGEYAPYNLYDLENLARASELFGISSMLKVDQEPNCFLAQRALKSGIQNILFTDIRTVEDAKECVRIVRPETPDSKGINGCHAARSVGYGLEAGSKEYVEAMNDVVIVFMIEKKGAVDNLEAILSVKGLDMVQFGPCDYGLSIGLARQSFPHPEVRKAELKTITMALKMGVRPRVELSPLTKEEDIQKYIELGVRDFNLPMDLTILYHYLKENGESLRKILAKV